MAAAQVDPRLVEAGMAAMRAGDLLTAEQLFGQMVQADPRVHQAWNLLAIIALNNALPALALERAQRANEGDRRNPAYLNTLAVAQGELGRHGDAKASLVRALKLRPAYAEGHYNLGKVHYKLEDMDAALASYRRAHAIDPAYPGVRYNLAQVEREKGHLDAAARLLREAAREPGEGDAEALLAEVLFESGGIDQAWAYCREVAASRPDLHAMRTQAAMLLLSAGRWQEGWQEYLWRTTLPVAERGGRGIARFRAARPGERLLLRQEQGIGDVLFFARFAPQAAARGLRITLEAHAKLLPVLAAGVPGVEQVVAQGSAGADPGAYDLALWLGDLPAALGDPGNPPAVPVQPDASLAAATVGRLAALGPPPYIGLTWRAGTDVISGPEFGAANQRQLFKALRVPVFAQALRGVPGTLVALQRAPGEGEVERLSEAIGAPVHDLSALNDDLPGMLAVLARLQDYVTVSNTNVHLLAGLPDAVRPRAHLLVPSPPEFRWMREGGASPWFPGIPLYRQTPRRDWSGAIAALHGALAGAA